MTKEFWSDFITFFFGTHNMALVLVCFIYGCIGMIIMMLIDVMGRDEESKRTPKKFEFSWFIRDNKARMLLNFFMMLVCIRFYSDFKGSATTPMIACIIGFLSDVLAVMAKNRKNKFKKDNEDSDKLVITNTNTQSTEIERTSSPGPVEPLPNTQPS